MTMEIPDLGLGTWQNENPEQCAESVATALDVGYRHVDTAQIYGNESAVGEGVAASDVDRDDVYLATKIWISNLASDDVLETFSRSLERLQTEYVDALYVHWPSGEYSEEDTLGAFEELADSGQVEDVGVSNFTEHHLSEALEFVDVAVNQFEMHPLLPQTDLVDACHDRDVEVVAYSPLARGDVFDVPEIQEVAERHDASEAQVSLAWLMENDVHPIPKATGRKHIEDNYGALDLELSDDDVTLIDGVEDRERKVDPDFAPDW